MTVISEPVVLLFLLLANGDVRTVPMYSMPACERAARSFLESALSSKAKAFCIVDEGKRV